MRLPRSIREYLHPVVWRVRSVLYAGRTRTCPCCGGNFRKFLTRGHPARPEAGCPRCGSLERHRLVSLYLRDLGPGEAGRVLHFAPTKATMPLYRRIASEYVTTDLVEHVDVNADITALPFPDERWDLIVCSHVLEHVGDDRRALRELRRVLAPDGKALLVVPRNHGVATDEDPSVTDPAERTRRFGQHDHVRIYGDDLEGRLRGAGFDSIEAITPDMFPAAEVERYRLREINAGNDDAALVCGRSS